MPGGHPLSCAGDPGTGITDDHYPLSKHMGIGGVSLGPQACVASNCHLSHLPSSRETLETSTLLLVSEPSGLVSWDSVQGPWCRDLLIPRGTEAFLRKLLAQMCSAARLSSLWPAARQP